MRDPRVDAVIAKAAPFAKPILSRIRRVVHAACPGIRETIKWGMPHFEKDGLLCGMAPFKAHCALWFKRERFRRVETLKDLPSDARLKALVREAARRNAKPGRTARKARAPLATPPALLAALRRDAKARANFAAFAPGKRRDYAEWIAEAKRPETRERRVATAVAWIAAGKGRNWRYE